MRARVAWWPLLVAFLAVSAASGSPAAHAEEAGDISFLNLGTSDAKGGDLGQESIVRGRSSSNHMFTVSAEMLALTRVGGRSFPLLTQTSDGSTVLSTGDLKFPMAYTPRFTGKLNEILFGGDLEFVYFGVVNWATDRTVPDPSSLQISFVDPSGGPVTSPVAFTYQSRLQSAEVNFWYPLIPKFSVLLGFRWLELQEGIASDTTVPPTNGNLTLFDANVINRMYGLQLGAGTQFVSGPSGFHVGASIKAGAYDNMAQSTWSAGPGGGVVLSVENRSHLAFVAQASLLAGYDITPFMTLRLGYEAFWMDGVTLAANQLANNADGDLRPATNGSLFSHGVSAGLQLNF